MEIVTPAKFMFEKLSYNLNLLMNEAHLSADELARRTGIPASTIKKIRNCDKPNPTLMTLIPLAQFFSIKLGQLVGDESLPKGRIKGQYQTDLARLHHLPVISWEEILNWPNSNNHSTITTEYHYSKNAYALVVEENDWENLVKGTVLLIDPLLKPEHRDFVITHKNGQKIPTLKQVLYDEEHSYLKPIINGYNIIPLTHEHKILGIVVEYKKDLRKF